VDVKAGAIDHRDGIETRLKKQLACLSGTPAPKIEPDGHCHTPYTCEHWDRCTATKPADWVFYMPDFNAGRRAELDALGVGSISAIPDDFRLSPRQEIVREVTRNGKPFIALDLSERLDGFGPPAFYLDFEAFLPAVPLYPGTYPYQTIPFQWSLHGVDSEGRVDAARVKRRTKAKLTPGSIQVVTHWHAVSRHKEKKPLSCHLLDRNEAHCAKGDRTAFSSALKWHKKLAKRILILTATPFGIHLKELERMLSLIGAEAARPKVASFSRALDRFYRDGDMMPRPATRSNRQHRDGLRLSSTPCVVGSATGPNQRPVADQPGISSRSCSSGWSLPLKAYRVRRSRGPRTSAS
jgi:hypothetical protein